MEHATYRSIRSTEISKGNHTRMIDESATRGSSIRHGHQEQVLPPDELILDLHQLISDQCPNAVKSGEIKNFFGRKVAIVSSFWLSADVGRVHSHNGVIDDRSMSIYQFMIAVRQQDGQQLMSDTGETTRYASLYFHVDRSHLMGMFYRTLRIIDNGIKPCYVFDGAPPTLKSGEVRWFKAFVEGLVSKTLRETRRGDESLSGSQRNRYRGRSRQVQSKNCTRYKRT